jgi:hypothetical protein
MLSPTCAILNGEIRSAGVSRIGEKFGASVILSIGVRPFELKKFAALAGIFKV